MWMDYTLHSALTALGDHLGQDNYGILLPHYNILTIDGPHRSRASLSCRSPSSGSRTAHMSNAYLIPPTNGHSTNAAGTKSTSPVRTPTPLTHALSHRSPVTATLSAMHAMTGGDGGGEGPEINPSPGIRLLSPTRGRELDTASGEVCCHNVIPFAYSSKRSPRGGCPPSG